MFGWCEKYISIITRNHSKLSTMPNITTNNSKKNHTSQKPIDRKGGLQRGEGSFFVFLGGKGGVVEGCNTGGKGMGWFGGGRGVTI